MMDIENQATATDTDETAEAPASPSVRETLEAALEDQASAPDREPIAQPPSDRPTASSTADTERPTPRQRAEQLTARAAPTSTAKPAANAPGAKATGGVEPPQHWSQEDKATFAKAPREFQEWATRRERETVESVQRAVQPIAPLLQVTERVKPYLDHIGVRPEQAFDNIVQIDYALRTAEPEQKLAILQKLASDYGISLPDNGASDEWEDPAVTALRKDLAAQAQQFQAHTQALQGQVQSVVRDRYITEIAALENEKDAAGKPAHPHLEMVANDIARIAHAERAAGRPIPPLKAMYEHAVQHNPQAKALVEKQQAQAAARARRPAAPRAQTGSVRAALQQAMAR